MKIFIAEYITGGGFAGADLPAALAAEGAMMRDALLRDFSAHAGNEVMVAVDARVAAPHLPHVHLLTNAHGDVWQHWQRGIDWCDAALLLAPESAGILLLATAMLERAAKISLSANFNAVKTCGSKYHTASQLTQRGVKVVPTWQVSDNIPASEHGYVIKPDDGVGSEGILYCADASAVRNRTPASGYVVQPYIQGFAGSLSVVADAQRAQVLAVNEQLHADARALKQNGVVVNSLRMREHLQQAGWHATRLQTLAQTICHAAGGLHGYFGVDFIINGSDLWVLEVNPRVTLSYVGLQESLGINPAALILAAAANTLPADPLAGVMVKPMMIQV